MYKRKTQDEYQIHQRTECGWEEVFAEDTRAEAKKRLAEYRANQPEYAAKMVKVRVKI